MRLSNRLAIFACVMLLGTVAQAQLKDMPSQAEFDPILENADSKIKDFIATLTKFRVEAAAMDPERLDKDLKDFQALRQLIQITRSGPHRDRNGVNMGRLVMVLGGVDDAALEAATWKSAAELQMCQQMVQHKDPSRYDQFGTQLAMELQLLREVAGQLFHPVVRAADAVDEILLSLTDATSKTKPKPR
jgi:hypothetical protein